MTLRQVPAAAIVGLLVALLAHAALYGGGHAIGGIYHAALVQLAVAGALGLAIACAALVWSGARYAADGSILATRLSARVPSFLPMLAGGAGWLALAEHLEPHHAGPALVVTLMALATAAWLVGSFARAIVRFLAGLVFAILRTAYAVRTPAWPRRGLPAPQTRRAPVLRRRFARPPPIPANARA